MLPFGSITSIVPLVVLGFAYVLFLCASVLNKNETTDADDFVSDKQIIIADNPLSKIPDNTIQYHDIQCADIFQEAVHDHIVCPFYISSLHDHPWKISDPLYGFSFTVRPPPVIS